MVSPCVDMKAYFATPERLPDFIEHGIINTLPNRRDEDLSGDALKSRAIAVAIGTQAAEAVKPTHVSIAFPQQAFASLVGQLCR